MDATYNDVVDDLKKQIEELKKELVAIVWAAARSNRGTLEISKFDLALASAHDAKVLRYEDVASDKIIFKVIDEDL